MVGAAGSCGETLILAVIALALLLVGALIAYGIGQSSARHWALSSPLIFVGGFLAATLLFVFSRFNEPRNTAVAQVTAPVTVQEPANGVSRTALQHLRNLGQPAIGNVDDVSFRMKGSDSEQHSTGVYPIDSIVVIHGWAGDALQVGRGIALFGIVDGTARLDFTRFYNQNRADVDAVNPGRDLADSGFIIDLPARSLGPGSHSLQLAIVARDGSGFEQLATPIQLTIR